MAKPNNSPGRRPNPAPDNTTARYLRNGGGKGENLVRLEHFVDRFGRGAWQPDIYARRSSDDPVADSGPEDGHHPAVHDGQSRRSEFLRELSHQPLDFRRTDRTDRAVAEHRINV